MTVKQCDKVELRKCIQGQQIRQFGDSRCRFGELANFLGSIALRLISFPCAAWECSLDARHPVSDSCLLTPYDSLRPATPAQSGGPCGAWDPEANAGTMPAQPKSSLFMYVLI